MLDAQNAPAAPLPTTIRREDYRPPDWLIPTIALDFDLEVSKTRVRTTMMVERNSAHDRPLILDGDGLTPITVSVDGDPAAGWRMDGSQLVIPISGDMATIETEVVIAPDTNTQLMGLYASGGLLCTQCEAEGFRRISFFADRPDILSRYTVRMTADRQRYPVLLSNGDNVANGDLPDERHWAEWHDPHPKPCYLFALVAGDLSVNRDHFTTMSGRKVTLGIWVRANDLPRTAHAMHALKTAMAWDETAYGREYDLDVFNIVAVDDFNFGAMENKGLNIFNSRYILADPETATDLDYDGILAVVAHEYFHNWSGNRVTCRDWFQLSLKEGFTVFRDQQFSADQGSAAVKRIEDVRILRAAQFPEDAGPLAHPIRPDSYLEITNFYTATIYNKGAEVIRMLHTMLGAVTFRKGSDLYFDRHDGEAATCDDFVAAMADASSDDLSAFKHWYSQAGTPKVTAHVAHDKGITTMTLTQDVPPTPKQPTKHPVAMPIDFALFDRKSGQRLHQQIHILNETTSTLRFDRFDVLPVLSINRNFSAPIIVETNRSIDDLAFLSAHDDDPFGRYEAMQQLMLETLTASDSKKHYDAVVAAVGHTLADPSLDPALIADAVVLPSEAFIGDQMAIVDPETIGVARDALRAAIGGAHADIWRDRYHALAAPQFEYTPTAKAARRLRGVALGYLSAMKAADASALAFDLLNKADNMTDQMTALSILANGDAPERELALDAFYTRYRHHPLVIDKWFTVQAMSQRTDTEARVRALLNHADFTLTNPNRVRALIGAFSVNQRRFHGDEGTGYTLLADQIIALDRLNPQAAARMVPAFGRWRRFDAKRQSSMREALEQISKTPDISKDVFEQASKTLG
jgi:aminopeptidase N